MKHEPLRIPVSSSCQYRIITNDENGHRKVANNQDHLQSRLDECKAKKCLWEYGVP